LSYPGGMLVLRRNGRTFGAIFGHAWLILEDQWLERDFGRRVALNTVAATSSLKFTLKNDCTNSAIWEVAIRSSAATGDPRVQTLPNNKGGFEHNAEVNAISLALNVTSFL
jgi:hypothetical protein